MTHQFGFLQQREPQIGTGLSIIIGIAQLQRPPAIIRFARHWPIMAGTTGIVYAAMTVPASHLFGIDQSPGVFAARRSRPAARRLMRGMRKKSSHLPFTLFGRALAPEQGE